MNWYPIETAPKDERFLLVWHSSKEFPDVMSARDLQHRSTYSWMDDITHWAPLPEPPK